MCFTEAIVYGFIIGFSDTPVELEVLNCNNKIEVATEYNQKVEVVDIIDLKDERIYFVREINTK